MTKKLFNVKKTYNETTNPNNLVVTPDGGDLDVLTSASQVYEIIIPIAQYLPSPWTDVGVSNPAIIDKVSSKIWVPNLAQLVLGTDYSVNKVVDGNPITNIVFKWIKWELSISANTLAENFEEVAFTDNGNKIVRFNNSGTLVLPNYAKGHLQVDFYGSNNQRLSYLTQYRTKLEGLLPAEQWSIVDSLTVATESTTQI